MKALAALLAAVFCAALPLSASAQERSSIFTVAGVNVDVTAPNAVEARSQAFNAATRAAYQRIAARLTLPGDLARAGGAPQLAQPQIDAIVASTEVDQERMAGGRYIGRFTVRFVPAPTRTVLRSAGLTVIEGRTAPLLVVPQAPDTPAETQQAWREAWRDGGFGNELAPLVPAPSPVQGAPSWNAAQPQAAAVSAAGALFAVLRVQGRTATAALSEVGPAGASRDRGQVQATIGQGPEGLRAALASLADQANLRVQNDWKARQAANSGARSRISASVLYANQAEWERIKDALERAAATVISDIRIEAVAREGALVSFAYVGDANALAAELRRLGVSLEAGAGGGTVLRALRR